MVDKPSEHSDIPALGNAYNHARRAYGLTSALLMAWELIGVELEASPVESLKITLKSPQAAPYVLIVLIVYFGFRTIIEWYQNDARRRDLIASKMDFAVAHGIAAASLSLYVYQTLSHIQVADIIPKHIILLWLIGMALGQLLFFTIIDRRHMWNKHRVLLFLSSSMGLLVIGAATWYLLLSVKINVTMLIAFGIGVVCGLGLMISVRWQLSRWT
jgi:hypothetical protein